LAYIDCFFWRTYVYFWYVARSLCCAIETDRFEWDSGLRNDMNGIIRRVLKEVNSWRQKKQNC